MLRFSNKTLLKWFTKSKISRLSMNKMTMIMKLIIKAKRRLKEREDHKVHFSMGIKVSKNIVPSK
jgi:hypothetical protein